MREASICLVVIAGLLGGCATSPEQAALGAFAEMPANGLVRLAAEIEAHGEIDTALGLYKQAAEQAPDASAYVRLGQAYARAGRTDQAISAFQTALCRDADNVDAMLGLGSALVRKRGLTDAIVILEKAAARGETPGILNQLGLAQMLTGRFAAGRGSLERATRLNPTNLDILSNLALAEALVGHAERAIELASQVMRPGAEQHRTRSAVVTLVLAGQPDGAREIADLNQLRGDVDDLLSRAAAIRTMPSPEARAQALGRLIG